MALETIKVADLPSATQVVGDDYLVVEQPDKTKKATVSQVISDLDLANKEDLAGTGGASLIGTSDGTDVQQSLDTARANERELWRRALHDLGLTLVEGSFEDGATLTYATDAIWHMSGAQCYTWGGTFPKTVPAKSTPSTIGGVSTSAWITVGGLSVLDETLAARDEAMEARDEAQAYTLQASEFGNLYASTEEGLAATTDGQYFQVPQGSGSSVAFKVYKNNAGIAQEVARVPGTAAIAGTIREFPTLAAAQADADADNIPTGSTTYVRSTDDTALAVEYINNGGTLVVTGRVMPSTYNPELSVVSAGMLLKLVSDVYSLTAGSYYTADGVLHTDGGSTWGMYKFPIKKGQWVKYTGPMGITTGSESIPVIAQLDSNQAWVSSLRTVNATGAAGVTFQTLYGQATQDGFIAVRGRTAETSTVGAINVYASYDEIVTTEDMLDAIEAGVEQSSQYGPGEDMTGLRYFQGSVFDDAGNWVTGKGSAYRTYFIPVQQGDVVKYTGAVGSFILAETLPILVQTDASRNFVGIVYPFETDTKILDRAAWGVATQTGFIAVYVRVVSGINFSITKFRRLLDYKTGVDFSAGLIDVTAEAEIIRNIQWQEDGSTVTATGWDYGVLSVKEGDTVLVDGWHDDFTTGVSRPVIVQLDQNKSWVSNLATFKTDGAGPVREVHIADAVQDGYVALIYRRSGNSPFKFMATRPQLIDPVDQYFDRQIEKNGYAIYTFAPKYSVNNTALDYDGNAKTDTTWRTIYVPAQQGDQLTLVTATGKVATGETARDGKIPYIIQLDKRRANPVVKAVADDKGALTGNKTLTATASADGYLACRVYALDWGWPSVRLSRPANGGGSSSAELPIVTPQIERLPVNMNALWDYNSSPYSQDNIIVSGNYQYAIVINASRNPVIMQRNKYGGPWTVFDLSTIAGNPLNAPTELDGHNVYSIAVTPSGRITVAGNMHGSAWRGIMSTNAHDITSWAAFDWGNAGTDNTYPGFLTFPDGTLLCYFRRGVRTYLSGISSADVLNSFRFAVGAKADGHGGPYNNRWVVDKAGVLHACWGYRMDPGSAGANEGLYYAKSADKGQTWTNAAGSTSWSLTNGSLNDVRSEKIFNAAQGSGYINQNGGCVDNNGYYHTCITQTDESGYTQIVHIWWDGSSWQSEVVSDFTFAMDLSLNLVLNDLSRPVIGCTPSGRVYIFYHTTKMGRQGQIRAIDVTTAGSPVDSVIALFDIGTQALACNTDLMLKTGDFVALLAKGTANSSSENYGVYSNQPVMLATIPMP